MNNNLQINCISNRASQPFFTTCKKFNKYVNENINSAYIEKLNKKNIILYWSSFGHKDIKFFDTDKIIQNIDNKILNYLSNKKTCANEIKKLKLLKYYPNTYNSIDEIENITDDKLFFIKNVFSTCCKGVKCITGKQLKKNNINKNEIIQEGITDLKLINDNKFVIRAYIIIFNKKIYLSKYGYCAVSDKKYEKEKSDFDIQVCSPNNRTFIELHKSEYRKYIDEIKEGIKFIKQIFDPIVINSQNKYIIIGPDILISSDGDIKFIEFNTFPNLVHAPHINKEVINKMILDLFKLVFLNVVTKSLIEIN